jgi:hypothetical protein
MRNEMKAAMADDPTVFAYDEVYDDIQAQKATVDPRIASDRVRRVIQCKRACAWVLEPVAFVSCVLSNLVVHEQAVSLCIAFFLPSFRMIWASLAPMYAATKHVEGGGEAACAQVYQAPATGRGGKEAQLHFS